MIYSIEAGGKRLRPILLMATYEAFEPLSEKVIPVACALEMIHTYSLIHDDLPAMDDDDWRRGKLTNHKKFDEATAILAGDGLLTSAFYVISSSSELNAEEKIFLLRELSKASGPEGMVAGQMMDLQAEGKTIDLKELEQIHLLKTGELIRFSVRAGAYLGGATPPQLEQLDHFSKSLGLIFQIQDDILDVTGNAEELGKPVGSDEMSEKSTYPKLLGLDGANEKKEYYMRKARESLKKAGIHDSILYEFIDFSGNRHY
ncbi:MAG: polyprenyl synthetase family protein [Bacillaceae bacterium]|nr:polyprenyl synthetase family protein [Bacillaceae bacterium]